MNIGRCSNIVKIEVLTHDVHLTLELGHILANSESEDLNHAKNLSNFRTL